ncbi:MAG: hypothetical protein HQ592_00235 [Planctomycetes bacterium]|nr:hypothetical protein [Planctomycetota bacterium]
MIYEFPANDAPIRQGDIFAGVPKLEISLNQVMAVTQGYRTELVSWDEIAKTGDPINAVVGARPVVAIVISQDCDASRAGDVTLCEIRAFQDVEGKCKDTTAPGKWAGIITQHARINQKWFYLPPDPQIGFDHKMGVDFTVSLRIARRDLEDSRRLRSGRLNDTAWAHFRERIAEFYRRYPYDEWYALNQEELQAYVKAHGEVDLFPWQSPHRPPNE